MSTDTAKPPPPPRLGDFFREILADPDPAHPKPKLAEVADELQKQKVKEGEG